MIPAAPAPQASASSTEGSTTTIISTISMGLPPGRAGGEV